MKRNMWGRAAHSLWFTLFAETGVVGTYLFLSVLIAVVRFLCRVATESAPENIDDALDIRFLAQCLLAAFAAFAAAASFLSVLYYPHVWILFAIVTAMQGKISRVPIRAGSTEPGCA
jgi:Na+-transporting methylmalonyl-CoA/oxaloacetate decarboxylase gamma subunit